jgi:hypothetical protein
MIRPALFLCFSCLLLFSSCRQQNHRVVNRSFYYWRTVFDLDSDAQKELTAQGINRLYIRFFDVVFNEALHGAVPQADIRFQSRLNKEVEVVPVIFITNEALIHFPDSLVDSLSSHIATRIRELQKNITSQKIKEVQLDCDWTEQTKEKYFQLLTKIKKDFGEDKPVLSVTIRLHQIKYYSRTGVPPADKGMLMFYNMGRLEDTHTYNSIYDEKTASGYLVNFGSYPLPLDIALPCFSWGVIFNQGHITGLLNNKEKSDLDSEINLEHTDETHYRVKKTFQCEGTWLQTGAVIRLESVDAAGCDKAAQQIAPYLKEKNMNVAVFQLKKNQLSNHEKELLDKVYHRFD